MCDSCAEGGRRCPGGLSPAARAAHNERRRENRAARSAAVSWATETGMPELARDVLAVAPPSVAKEWAQRAGAPEVTTKHPRLKPPASGLVDAGWATPEIVDQIAAVARLQGHPAEDRLLSAVSIDAERTDEGVNGTFRLMFEDGSDGYFKRIDSFDEEIAEDYGHDGPYQSIHEAVAWQTARRVFGPPLTDIVPPCVLTVEGGRLGSLAQGRPGGVEGRLALSDQDLSAAAMFDCLTGQQDRHPHNFLTSNSGTSMTLIDHGFAFARPGDPLNQSIFMVHRLANSPQLTDRERVRLRALVESPTMLGLRPMLSPDRAAAMGDRARRMLAQDRLLRPGEF